MKSFARCISLLLVLLFFTPPAQAALLSEQDKDTLPDLPELIEEFCEEYGLNEDNFAMGYCYTATGEYYYYNKEKLMPGASTYKLPLNMCITEGIADGTFSESDYVAGYSLKNAQYMSMVHSDNPSSQALQKYLVGYQYGYYYAYRESISRYSGTFLEKEIPAQYYTGNYFSPEFMLNTLSYLYDHSGDFETILGYMKEAQPGHYFKLYVDEYEIAHKYGFLNGAVNDVGIVYTPNPFLLAVYTKNTYGEEILGAICERMCEYTLQLDEHYEQLRIEIREENTEKAEASASRQAEMLSEEKTEIITEQLRIKTAEALEGLADSAISYLRIN